MFMECQLLYLDSMPIASPANGDAGYDLPIYGDFVIGPKSLLSVKTGIAVAVPKGFVGFVVNRSGNAFKRSLFVQQGVIDSGYRGEVGVLLYNGSDYPIRLNHGDKIAQMVVCPVYNDPVVEVDSLPDGERGPNGFGSTGLAGDVIQEIKESANASADS
jgi:dUTP pyrophosphatase